MGKTSRDKPAWSHNQFNGSYLTDFFIKAQNSMNYIILQVKKILISRFWDVLISAWANWLSWLTVHNKIQPVFTWSLRKVFKKIWFPATFHPHNVRGPQSTCPTATSGPRTPDVVRMVTFTKHILIPFLKLLIYFKSS